MFTCFHKILPWHLPFKNVICNIVVAINFYIFEHVIVFVMVSNDVIIMLLPCDSKAHGHTSES